MAEEDASENQITQFTCRRFDDGRRIESNEDVDNKETDQNSNASNETDNDREWMAKVDRRDLEETAC